MNDTDYTYFALFKNLFLNGLRLIIFTDNFIREDILVCLESDDHTILKSFEKQNQ